MYHNVRQRPSPFPSGAMSLFGSDSLPETFPEVRACTLDGDDCTLPADLPAPLALVIVLFRDEMDPLADQWARLGHQAEEAHPGLVAVVETPVIGRGMKLFGSLATAGIRGQVEGDEEHARTLPIYVDKKPFRKALKIKNEDDVYAYLVERETGAILWGGDGQIDMDELRSLEAAITEALPSVEASRGTMRDTEPEDQEAPAAFDGPGELSRNGTRADRATRHRTTAEPPPEASGD